MFFGRQAAVVDEVAIARIGVPGRHPAVVDYFANHRRMLASVIIRQKRKRGDLAGPMAVLAFVLEDRGHTVGISDLTHFHGVLFVAGGERTGDLGRGGPDSGGLDFFNRL